MIHQAQRARGNSVLFDIVQIPISYSIEVFLFKSGYVEKRTVWSLHI